MIVDLKLSLTEITFPANIRGTSVIIPQLDIIKDSLGLRPEAVNM